VLEEATGIGSAGMVSRRLDSGRGVLILKRALAGRPLVLGGSSAVVDRGVVLTGCLLAIGKSRGNLHEPRADGPRLVGFARREELADHGHERLPPNRRRGLS